MRKETDLYTCLHSESQSSKHLNNTLDGNRSLVSESVQHQDASRAPTVLLLECRKCRFLFVPRIESSLLILDVVMIPIVAMSFESFRCESTNSAKAQAMPDFRRTDEGFGYYVSILFELPRIRRRLTGISCGETTAIMISALHLKELSDTFMPRLVRLRSHPLQPSCEGLNRGRSACS